WLVTAPIALILVIFAVSNRDDVVIAFWPLPLEAVEPLYLVVLVSLVLGLFVGLLIAWLNGWGRRREARSQARRIEALERELAATQAQLPTSQAARLPVTAARRD
ncbi:MAG TPA: lipopolysaccharide assembly protein LapA domain-containing protein, partial [Stellaceae bacterium]|nr:lipopolysaccharide assembly protein LapA domain-containing protein [Stellaceae bacterium]